VDLRSHLADYGIRHFDDGSYRTWRDRVLGEARMAELEALRRPLLESRARPSDLARYWDYIAQPEVSSAVLSGRADAIWAAGEFVSRQLISLVPPHGAILDIGCNAGYLTTYYAAALPQAQVTGCDLSPACIERAVAEASQRKLEHASFRCADWLQGLAREQFDAVVATQVLGFVHADEAALSRLASLVSGGGRLICVESFGSPEEAESFIARLASLRLGLEKLETLRFSDAGVPGECPGMVLARTPRPSRLQKVSPNGVPATLFSAPPG
jgi:2-polyprenyl-3-methyl-5-hydroxy-6-metoxy-1,4-benzoquinol methylase